MIYDKKSIFCIQNFTVTQHSVMCVSAVNTMDLPASHLLTINLTDSWGCRQENLAACQI